MSPAKPQELDELRQALQRPGAAPRHTVYECPDCAERFVGQRRCDDCGRFCRALGLGGVCPDCAAIILLAELFEGEVPPS
jgi:hypothetical protein